MLLGCLEPQQPMQHVYYITPSPHGYIYWGWQQLPASSYRPDDTSPQQHERHGTALRTH